MISYANPGRDRMILQTMFAPMQSPMLRSDNMNSIPIVKYETKLNDRGEIQIFAIPKDKKLEPIEMPLAFKEMCNEMHLAVRKVDCEAEEIYPELFGVTGSSYYIPLRTVKE